MKIYDMFQKDIDRQINGVIKVMQTDDENRRQELEEYVITRELRKHFGSFYDHYEQSVDGATDQMGVWISGLRWRACRTAHRRSRGTVGAG